MPSAYSKRNDASTAVPLEEDSDSDFNPGAYVPEEKKRRRSRKNSRGVDDSESSDSQRPPSKKRRRDTLAKIGTKSSRSITTRKPPPVPLRPNLLLQYFGDIGIKPASDSEKEDGNAKDDEEEEEEEEREGSDAEDDDEGPPPLPRTLAVMLKKPAAKSRTTAADEDSVTEYETELESDSPGPSGPAPEKLVATQNLTTVRQPPKKPQKPEDPEESVTESEDGEPQWVYSKPTPPAQKPSVPAGDDDSETEPESDVESFIEDLQIRPAFPQPEGRSPDPLVLGKKHKVPGSINVFLREYQRDGVRFFWERYREGRGGVLGDDMGLAKLFK
ncbi:hypothetical protein C8Q78DRAFT_214764 [Trametes maxima]|nr:hypothetical protein C8Q78DRAFT_214764 [Trametes maxima]